MTELLDFVAKARGGLEMWRRGLLTLLFKSNLTKDMPSAEVHILEFEHFARDEKSDEILALTNAFLIRGNER